MPPVRRKTPTPPVKGRRPKVAGSTIRPNTQSRTTDTPTDVAETPDTGVSTVEQSVTEVPDKKVPEKKAAEEKAPETKATETKAETAPDTESPKADTVADEQSTAEPKKRRKIIPGATSLRRRKSAAVDADADAVTESAEPDRSRLNWKLVSILAAAAVVLGVFALVAAFKPGAKVSNPAWVDTAATQEVTSAARSAIETLYTYKADSVDQDFDKARGVLNPSMREEFDRTADTTKSAVVQTKTATDAEVTDVGVKLLSDDRAELIASMNVSASNDGQAQGSAQGPLSVSMEKVDGKWLLSKIDDQ